MKKGYGKRFVMKVINKILDFFDTKEKDIVSVEREKVVSFLDKSNCWSLNKETQIYSAVVKESNAEVRIKCFEDSGYIVFFNSEKEVIFRNFVPYNVSVASEYFEEYLPLSFYNIVRKVTLKCREEENT